MERSVQITFRNIEHSDALDAHIRKRVSRLDHYFPNITGCHVVVEMPHRHKLRGNLFNVRLDITVPGKEIVISRDLHEDAYVALREIFDAARRRLEDFARRQRETFKVGFEPLSGKVSRLFMQEGYGFVETTDADEYYFAQECVTAPGFHRLNVGDVVRFDVDRDADIPRAKRVSLTADHAART